MGRITVLVLFILTSWSLVAQKTLRDEIDKIIRYDTEISFDLTPGFIIGVQDNDSTYVLSFGQSLDEDRGILNDEDVFEMGSLTKPFTVLAIEVLVQQGKLKTTTFVNDILPDEYKNPRLTKLTVSDLLTQKSPFPKRPSMFGEYEDDPQNPYKSYTKADLLTFYKNYVPEYAENFNYSYVNFALLEVIIEEVTKLDFEVFITEEIFKPLKMKRSFFHLKEKKNEVVTQGVNLALHKVNPWTFSSFAGSEGLKSSLGDLLQFTKAYAANSGTYLDKICPPLLKEKIPSFNEDLFYTAGWYTFAINKKTRVIASSGRTNGHSSFIGMVPENKTAVVVLSNSAYGTMDLGMLILRMINHNWKRKPQ